MCTTASCAVVHQRQHAAHNNLLFPTCPLTHFISKTDKKRAENKEQQVKGLLARIDALEGEKQQLSAEAASSRQTALSAKGQLARSQQQLQDAQKQHQQELQALKQQLSQAQQDLQRTQSSSFNNAAAECEGLRQQLDASREAAAAAQAQLSKAQQEQQALSRDLEQAKKEKGRLLESMQQLLKLNQELQQRLETERQAHQQVGRVTVCVFVCV